MKRLLTIAMIVLAAASCGPKVKLVPEKNFDKELDGKKVALYTIKGGDLIAQVTNFGGRVVSLWVPNKDGGMTDVVLGHNTWKSMPSRMASVSWAAASVPWRTVYAKAASASTGRSTMFLSIMMRTPCMADSRAWICSCGMWKRLMTIPLP